MKEDSNLLNWAALVSASSNAHHCSQKQVKGMIFADVRPVC